MTLTEMLDRALNGTLPESQAEKEANFYEIECIKKVFNEWLKTVGLPTHLTIKQDRLFDTTASIRRLLVALVDEP